MENLFIVMTRSNLIIVVTVIFWLAVGGLVLRTNRLWFGPVTFRWPNLNQANQTFRWGLPAADNNVVIPASASRSFKVTVPRKFSFGELLIATAPGQGVLTVSINAPAGKNNTTATTPAGGIATVSLTWNAIAWQERTFIVQVVSDDHPIDIRAISIKLSR